MGKEEIDHYPGKKVDVTWDGRLCIHIGECNRAKSELFVRKRDPWVQPDLVGVDEAIEVVKRCPTGAITFSRKDGGSEEQAEQKNTVVVSYRGPLFVSGELDIQNAPEDMPGVRFRAALCRCGHTQNQPFCDNSHESANFDDCGAVGETGAGPSALGGKLKINREKDGPLVLSGNFTIFTGSSREAWRGNQASLCRCGQSKNKPFCDWSHVQAGFVAD